jgi:hypothetical protein
MLGDFKDETWGIEVSTDVAVVGAGPYGLSTAAHLAHQGVAVRTFGQPMDTWRRSMPAGMLLKSDGFASSLSAPVAGWTVGEHCEREGLPYADRNWPRVVLEQFVEYGADFQRQLVPDSDDRLVAEVTQVPGGFSLRLDDGEVSSAKRVVLAVGITHFAYIPPELRGLGDRVTHSGSHRTFDAFAGKRVAVIGAGSSAVEVTAALLDAGAEVHLLARRSEVPFWGAPNPDAPARSPRQELRHQLDRLRNPSSGLGPGLHNRFYQQFPDVFSRFPADRRLRVVRQHLGPVSPWWLRDKVLAGADIRTGTTVIRARSDDDAVILNTVGADSQEAELRVDHVICGTGYAADIDRLTFLDPALRASLRRVGAMPELSRHFESSIPGLYFVGAAAAGTFGPLLRFVVGVEFAAPRVSAHLASLANPREVLAVA